MPIKRVDRLPSNKGMVVSDLFTPWVAQAVGERTKAVVAMYWTDFDADDQTSPRLSDVTVHGLATRSRNTVSNYWLEILVRSPRRLITPS